MLQAFASSLSLGTGKSPHTDTGREDVVLWQGLRSESGADTAPAAHISYYAYHSSDYGSELSALSHTVSLEETPALQIKSIYRSTAHSFSLHLQSPPEAKHWRGADQRLKHTSHCTG